MNGLGTLSLAINFRFALSGGWGEGTARQIMLPSCPLPLLSESIALPSYAGGQGYRDRTNGQGEQRQAMQNHEP